MPSRSMPPSRLDRSSPLPLWAQLLDDLRVRLAAGEFAETFPTDRELIETYDVSRHTAREAVRRLQADGLLDRERGRLTTVRRPSIQQPTGQLYSLFASVEEQGFRQRSKVLELSRRRNELAAGKLGLAVDATMLCLRRLRLADETPMAVDEIWLPDLYSAQLLRVDFEHTALYLELARLGVRPTAGQERIAPGVPDPETRAVLGLKPGQAVFVVERFTETDGEPLEWRCTKVRGDQYSFITTWSQMDGSTASLQRLVEPAAVTKGS